MPDSTPDHLSDRTTEDSVRDGAASWLVALDTGGTFTDLVARDPRGTILRAKVPSDGSILATLLSVERASSANRARIRPAAGLGRYLFVGLGRPAVLLFLFLWKHSK